MSTIKPSENLSPKEVQNTLLASELRYRRLFESAKDGILILDAATGQIDDVNPFLIELLGFSREDLVSKKVWEIGFFKDIIANRDNFLELREKRYLRYEDLPLETSSGRKIDVEFVSNVYPEDHHDVIQCNIRDITERKRTADLIEAERERLAVTLRSIGDGVIATDANGNIEIMNAVAEELCGWKQDEAKGKPLISIFNIINESTRSPHENPVEKVLATGEIIELANHTVIIAKDGTERIIADSAAPIRDRKKRIIGVVLVFRDITEKEKLLQAIQRNQKLESLGLLAGGIAHDFNNLMGGLFGYIDMAIDESSEEKVVKRLSKAMATIDRARGLTQQLLTFAKGGNPIQEATPITQLIQDTAYFALSGSNVTCRFDLADDLSWCNIDKNQISQVIDNIVINAQQAMPNGGSVLITAKNVTIAENEHPILSKGNYVKVSATDTGIGISKKILSRIFDPFFTTKPKGHGLGLATCYSIVNRHCGAIDVESVLDEGTTFHVYLPASEATRSEDLVKTEIKHRGCGKIVIMDDEEVMQETIMDMLEKLGYTVECKNDGTPTLEYFISEYDAKRPITAFILDLTIPGGMGGKDVVREIRKLDTKVPVFVASGYADDPIMKKPAEYGFTASIVKPFRIADLANLLEIHLGSS
ncbi:MAG TPA: PAS domain S-box protein [Chitinispirillaceae bacterium]|nr:PAS domain S-box protein [Chitinispirillaceae bacterium]